MKSIVPCVLFSSVSLFAMVAATSPAGTLNERQGFVSIVFVLLAIAWRPS